MTKLHSPSEAPREHLSDLIRSRSSLPQLDAALLDTLLTTVPVGFAFLDRDLRYQIVNEAMAEINGLPASEHIGHTVNEVAPGRSADIAKLLRAVIETDRPRANVEVVRESSQGAADGRTWLGSFYPVKDEQKRVLGVGAIIAEITERKRAQDALASKSQEILTIFESITDAFLAVDREWRITYLNQESERLLRRSRTDVVGKTLREAFPESSGTAFRRHFYRAARERVTISFTAFHKPLETWFDVRVYPSANGLSIYFRDITRQKVSEEQESRLQEAVREAARQQRKFLREMLAAMTEGRLQLLDDPTELPQRGEPYGEPMRLSLTNLRQFRHCVREAGIDLGLPEMRWQDLVSAAGEASENAIVHAGGGEGRIYVKPRTQTVQVWIVDRGGGIEETKLHRATLERGFTTAGSMGHGFFFILRTADRVWLLTGTHGTTIVLEQDKEQPVPDWLRSDL